MSVFMTLWWSVCVCAWLAAGAPSPTSVQQEDDEAPGYFHETVEEYCTCRCDGCFWQNTCRNNGEHVQKEVCEANQGTWCSCAQQAILLAAAAKSNYSTFQADIPYVGGGEAVGGGEKAPSGTAADTKPPHIVFVLADDIGYNDLSWRNPFAQTPTLQKLRDGGVELTSYYTQSMCSPSRAALATGPLVSGWLLVQCRRGLHLKFIIITIVIVVVFVVVVVAAAAAAAAAAAKVGTQCATVCRATSCWIRNHGVCHFPKSRLRSSCEAFLDTKLNTLVRVGSV